MTLDPLSEIAELQTENDCLRERLKLAEQKLQASLQSSREAMRMLNVLEAQFQREREELREEFSALVASVSSADGSSP